MSDTIIAIKNYYYIWFDYVGIDLQSYAPADRTIVVLLSTILIFLFIRYFMYFVTYITNKIYGGLFS